MFVCQSSSYFGQSKVAQVPITRLVKSGPNSTKSAVLQKLACQNISFRLPGRSKVVGVGPDDQGRVGGGLRLSWAHHHAGASPPCTRKAVKYASDDYNFQVMKIEMSNLSQNLLKKETFGAIAELHQVRFGASASSMAVLQPKCPKLA